MLPPKNRLATGTHAHRRHRRRRRARRPAARGPGRRTRRSGCDPSIAVRRTRTGVSGTAPDAPQAGGAVALGGGAVDPGEEPGAGALHVDRLRRRARPAPRRANCARHADAVLVLRQAVVGVEGRGTAVRRAGSTRRTRRRGAGRARRRTAACHAATMSRTRSASARVCGRISGSVVWSLTPSGTTPTVASAGKRSRTPSSVSSSASPSLMPGHTTTWPCTSMPASSSAASQRRLVAPRRLRSSRARSSGSVAWMLT